MRPARILCVLILALAIAGAAGADVPHLMSYQGVLKDDVGNVVADGDYVLTFGIYDVESGGTPLWSEDQTAAVSGGIFNVTLGTVTPLGLDFDGQYWLGIAVEHGSELVPRVRLTASPYAFRAAVAESLAAGAVADADWLYSGDDIYRLDGEVGVGTSSPTAKLHVDVDAETAGRFESSGTGSTMTLDVENTVGNAARFTVGSPGSSYPGVPTAVYGVAGGSGNGGHFSATGTGTGLLAFSSGASSALHAGANGTGYSGYFSGGSGVRVVGDCNVDGFRMATGASTGHVLTSDTSGHGTWHAPAAVPDDDWTVYPGGVYRLEGYVGIGLAAPGRTLHIKEDADWATGIYLENDDTGPASALAIQFLTEDGGAGIILYDDLCTYMPSGMSITNGQYYGGIQFRTGGNQRLLISGYGNVGIDEPDPQERLDVGGTVQMDGFQLTDSPASGHILVSDLYGVGTWQPPSAVSDGDWDVWLDDLSAAVSGNVGIGTAIPAAKLDINIGAASTVEGFRLQHSGSPTRMVNLERAAAPSSANDIVQIRVPSNAPDDAQFIECERGTSPVFQVMTDGSIVADGGGSFDDAVDITGPLTVDNLGMRTGDFASGYVSNSTHVVHAEVTGTGTGDAIAVYGLSAPSDNYGIGGYFTGGYRGVVGSVAQTGAGAIRGVYGTVAGGTGSNYGVYGNATGGYACYGLYGVASGGASVTYAGFFSGNVHVSGTLSKSAGTFKIDHPLDPANKYLSHSFVESPDMMNVYNGNVVMDGVGEAWVELPEWFEVLNRDFRYQLTALDAPAPNLYVGERISGNRFMIAGGEPGMEVSWQVTGVRQDEYARAHPVVVEEAKPAHDVGKYLHPDLYGLPETAAVGYVEEREIIIEPSERAPKPERVWDPTDGE